VRVGKLVRRYKTAYLVTLVSVTVRVSIFSASVNSERQRPLHVRSRPTTMMKGFNKQRADIER